LAFAPAKTPAQVITNANAAINAALKEKSVIDSLALSGMVPVGGSAADMAKSMKSHTDYWGPVVKKIGFTAES
jgi:tripartite-type tricarboxylate transporter receptor subunit TctC